MDIRTGKETLDNRATESGSVWWVYKYAQMSDTLTMANMANTIVCCLLIDHDSEPIDEPFLVAVPPHGTLENFRQGVKDINESLLEQVDRRRLEVLRCTDRTIDLFGAESEALADLVSRLIYEKKTEKLRDVRKKVEDLHLEVNETLLVRIHDLHLEDRPGKRRKMSPGSQIRPPSEAIDGGKPDVVPFFEQLHDTFWNKPGVRSRYIYDVTFTPDNFEALQTELGKKNATRSSDSFEATESVASIKTQYIHALKNSTDSSVDAGPDADGVDMALPPLPFKATLLDLTEFQSSLSAAGLLHETIILVRAEYLTIFDIIDKTRRHFFLTGQPGIGKTYFLYYVLVERLLQGKTTIFQLRGKLYVFGPSGMREMPVFSSSADYGDDIWALIDGDPKHVEPHHSLGNLQIRKVMAASPKTKVDRGWIKQINARELVMMPWNWQELFVGSQFLFDRDVTNRRLVDAILTFGYAPRTCFWAACGKISFREAEIKVKKAVTSITDVTLLLRQGGDRDAISHKVFEIRPATEERWFDEIQFQPVSDWVLGLLLKQEQLTQTHDTLKLYTLFSAIPPAGSTAGKLWEHGVHNLFVLSTASSALELKSLDKTQSAKFVNLGEVHVRICTTQDCQGFLEKHVNMGTACYLHFTQKNFAGIDAVIYIPGQPIICLQITRADRHDINILGLQTIQSWLTIGSPAGQLRPTVQHPWLIVFVVPSLHGCTYDSLQALVPPKRPLGGVPAEESKPNIWQAKTKQYLVELNPSKVFVGNWEGVQEGD